MYKCEFVKHLELSRFKHEYVLINIRGLQMYVHVSV